MKPVLAIQVKDLTKAFRLRAAVAPTLKSAVVDYIKRGRAAQSRQFEALRGASFEVGWGETLGIIGSNGAGKSTLLSILAGTVQPTSGTCTTHGRVSSLLELGAGFHPDLTGRENVLLYGVVMGMTRRQILERMDRIIEFAGISEFIDQPVKYYSSGMYVRLGFAVATEVEPDILLIDEVLAVGDTDFQQKCLARIQAFRDAGKTLLIVSHDLKTIQSVSDRILLLDHGRVLGLGEPGWVVAEYQKLTREKNAKLIMREWGTGEAKITDIKLANAAGKTTTTFQWKDSVALTISYETQLNIVEPVFGLAVTDGNGRIVFGTNTQIEKVTIPQIKGSGTIRVQIKDLSLGVGEYRLSVSLHSSDHKTNYHRLDNKFSITVEHNQGFEGVAWMRTEWSQ